MPHVRVPALLRYYLDDQTEVVLPGRTVAEVLACLSQRYPRIQTHLFDRNGDVRRHVNIFVNADHIRDLAGLQTVLAEGDIVKLLPSVTGG